MGDDFFVFCIIFIDIYICVAALLMAALEVANESTPLKGPRIAQATALGTGFNMFKNIVGAGTIVSLLLSVAVGAVHGQVESPLSQLLLDISPLHLCCPSPK